MKTKIFATILVACMAIGSLTGCGSTAETETEVVSQTQEETVADSVEETVDETDVVEEESDVMTEEKLEVEDVAETDVAEESEEVVEKTYERKDFIIHEFVTNFDENETDYKFYLSCKDTHSSNDYLDAEIMAELDSRGYNIDNFIVTYAPAINANGNWNLDNEEVPFHSFEGISDDYVKLYPIFIKYGDVDTTKSVYNFTKINEETTEQLDLEYDDNAGDTWYKIFDSIYNMKQDETFEEIDFNILECRFSNEVQKCLDEIVLDENIKCDKVTINDWYNGMIYAMFVDKTVDLDGYFDLQSNMY